MNKLIIIILSIVLNINCGDSLYNIIGEQRTNKLKSIINEENVNEKLKFGHTPIMVAAEYNNLEAVKYLVNIGANVNDTDEYGRTALFYACEMMIDSNKIDIIKYLIEHGAEYKFKAEYSISYCEYDNSNLHYITTKLTPIQRLFITTETRFINYCKTLLKSEIENEINNSGQYIFNLSLFNDRFGYIACLCDNDTRIKDYKLPCKYFGDPNKDEIYPASFNAIYLNTEGYYAMIKYLKKIVTDINNKAIFWNHAKKFSGSYILTPKESSKILNICKIAQVVEPGIYEVYTKYSTIFNSYEGGYYADKKLEIEVKKGYIYFIDYLKYGNKITWWYSSCPTDSIGEEK